MGETEKPKLPERPKVRMWPVWQKYVRPPAGEYYGQQSAHVFYVFAVLLFGIAFLAGWLTRLFAGEVSFGAVFVIACILIGLICLKTAIKGGWWEMAINAAGIVWSTPDRDLRQFLWDELKAFDIQYDGESYRYRLHLVDGSIVKIPDGCCMDPPALRSALSMRIPCVGVFSNGKQIATLEDISRPFWDRVKDRYGIK